LGGKGKGKFWEKNRTKRKLSFEIIDPNHQWLGIWEGGTGKEEVGCGRKKGNCVLQGIEIRPETQGGGDKRKKRA